MNPQLKLISEGESWSVVNTANEPPTSVAIDSKTLYEDRDELVRIIENRGLTVWSDGTLSRDPEPVVESSNEDVFEKEPEASPVQEETPEPEAKSEPVSDVEKTPKKRTTRKRTSVTPAEQKARRAEYAKNYRKKMTEEQKEKAREAARERQKRWREKHPEKAAAYAKRSSERRKERYNEDPKFRAAYREQQREYAQARREAD